MNKLIQIINEEISAIRKNKGRKADWYAYSNNETSKEKQKELQIVDTDKRKAWEWLAKLLERVINERHEMLDDDNGETKLTEPKDSATPINENKNKSDYSQTKESLLRSKSIDVEMKKEILKYLGGGSTYHEGGRVTGLIKPQELKEKSKKTDGVGFGADKDGFFVYTHRARSKSHLTPDKITIKEIDFIDSTG
jgi:hypothetical protein